MKLDLGGALLIGSACSLLFVTLVTRCAKARAVTRARQQHYTRASSSVSSLSSSAAAFLDSMPPRLRYGLVFGGLASLWPAVSQAFDLGATSLAPLDAVTGAFGTASKWMLIAGIASWIRTQGVVRLRAALNNRHKVDA